jgi:hypothetical protein
VTGAKRLSRPRLIDVQLGDGDLPTAYGATPVESVLEDWLVEDRWWSDRPVRRRYLELVLENGRCVLVFRDLTNGRWYSQRG